MSKKELVKCSECLYAMEGDIADNLKRSYTCLKNPPVVSHIATGQGIMSVSAVPDVSGHVGCFQGEKEMKLSS